MVDSEDDEGYGGYSQRADSAMSTLPSGARIVSHVMTDLGLCPFESTRFYVSRIGDRAATFRTRSNFDSTVVLNSFISPRLSRRKYSLKKPKVAWCPDNMASTNHVSSTTSAHPRPFTRSKSELTSWQDQLAKLRNQLKFHLSPPTLRRKITPRPNNSKTANVRSGVLSSNSTGFLHTHQTAINSLIVPTVCAQGHELFSFGLLLRRS